MDIFKRRGEGLSLARALTIALCLSGANIAQASAAHPGDGTVVVEEEGGAAVARSGDGGERDHEYLDLDNYIRLKFASKDARDALRKLLELAEKRTEECAFTKEIVANKKFREQVNAVTVPTPRAGEKLDEVHAHADALRKVLAEHPDWIRNDTKKLLDLVPGRPKWGKDTDYADALRKALTEHRGWIPNDTGKLLDIVRTCPKWDNTDDKAAREFISEVAEATRDFDISLF